MDAKLSSKGQVVIPKKIRDNLGLNEQTPLKIYEQEGKIIIEPSVSAEDPWEGMEILDFEGELDDLVRDSLKHIGEKIVGNLKGD